MTLSLSPDLSRAIWSHSLFDALFNRRTRRFGLGFALEEGPFRHHSTHSPVPLTEVEEAVLVTAGIGFSGMALWDHSVPLPFRSADGRVFPSTNRGRRTALFFTNDSGVFVIDPAAGSSDRMNAAEGDGPDLLALYRDHRIRLRDGRLDVPRAVPPLCGHNLWAANMPGATWFMPVCDVSQALISLIAQFVDPALRRFADGGRGASIVDDRHGFRPAGTERWLRDGFLDRDNVVTLSMLERQACYFMFSEPAAICQNIFLATEALGLGGWKHCGILSAGILEALGFRVTVPPGGKPFANPIGLAGVFQVYCPPWYATMADAVDAVLRPLRDDNATGAPAPFLVTPTAHRDGCVTITDEGIACAKSVCDYVFDTYGRFPGGTDAMHLMWCMQVHHIDTDFYDVHYRPGAYGPTHATHFERWHGG